MEQTCRQTLCKAERLNKKTTIEKLFAGGNLSMASFPFRAVCMSVPKNNDIPASILISVPKRKIHHAVGRNRMKRLAREAYRKNKYLLWDFLKDKDYSLAIAFICISDSTVSSATVEKSMKKMLKTIAEKFVDNKKSNRSDTSCKQKDEQA